MLSTLAQFMFSNMNIQVQFSSEYTEYNSLGQNQEMQVLVFTKFRDIICSYNSQVCCSSWDIKRFQPVGGVENFF